MTLRKIKAGIVIDTDGDQLSWVNIDTGIFFVHFSGESKLVLVRYFELDQFFVPVRSFFPLS